MQNRTNNQGSGVTARRVVTLRGRSRLQEPSIETTQMAGIEGDQFAEDEFLDIPVCPCGAVMRTPEEFGAIDAISGEILCLECAKVKWQHCHKSIGVETRVGLFGDIYCRRCALRLALFTLLFCVVLAAVICFVIYS